MSDGSDLKEKVGTLQRGKLSGFAFLRGLNTGQRSTLTKDGNPVLDSGIHISTSGIYNAMLLDDLPRILLEISSSRVIYEQKRVANYDEA